MAADFCRPPYIKGQVDDGGYVAAGTEDENATI